IISVDENHRIVLFNRGAESIFGWEAGEILGQPLDRLLPERARGVHPEHMEKFGRSPVRARRMGERQEILGRRRDGEEFPAEASISKLDLDRERLYTVVLRDVSERRRQEMEQTFLVEVGKVLASSLDLEDTLATIADMTVGFLADYCVVDLVEESGQVRRIRAAAREDVDQSVARTLQDVGLDRSRPHLMFATLQTGRPRLVAPVEPGHLEELAQGQERLEALRAMEISSYMVVPLVSREKMVGALLLARGPGRRLYDAQDLELAGEVGLRAGMAVENARLYRDAQRAIQARDDVLGVVSHDLGNPLQAVFIGLEALERGRANPESAEEDRMDYYLSAIRRSADLMQRLIHDLLEVRRMEEGHLALDRGPVELPPLVGEALEVIEPLARVKSVELVDRSGSRKLPPVEADRDRLLQVLSNLIGNAVKHTPEGGRVDILVELDTDELQISVADTGPGIPPEEQEQVFDRFWRAEKTGGKGIGLGLAIARGIVQTHGGRIWVESEEGEGSTFHFTIPLHAARDA
ncbi:MAG: ATP-binding protein, partial [bacterium]